MFVHFYMTIFSSGSCTILDKLDHFPVEGDTL